MDTHLLANCNVRKISIPFDLHFISFLISGSWFDMSKPAVLCSEDKMNVPCSKLQLRGVPRILSLNCTDNILAVNYDADGKSFVDIFSVESLASNVSIHPCRSMMPFIFLVDLH